MLLARRNSDASQPYVLVVEDEALLRAFVAEELRMAGLCVVEAADADDAWSYVAAGGPVDLLFADVQMPGSMNGVELARKLKARSAHLDVIITSGKMAPDEATDLGAFLAKPYSPARVVAAVLTALRSKGGAER
jgi:two-component system, response regulator PdtaR